MALFILYVIIGLLVATWILRCGVDYSDYEELGIYVIMLAFWPIAVVAVICITIIELIREVW